MTKLHRPKTYKVCLISLLIKIMQIKNKIFVIFRNGKDQSYLAKPDLERVGEMCP